MPEQKLKAYRFYTKIRNNENNGIAKKQFIIVAYGLKEAKELFEIIIENWKKWELIEIKRDFSKKWELIEIKRDFSKKWNNPYYMRHCYESLAKMVKRIMGEKE